MLAVIPSGPVQAPGPPTSLHTVRGSSLTVSPPWPTCTPLLPPPVQTGWLAASPRKGCPRGCRPRPQTRSVPKTSDSAAFYPGLARTPNPLFLPLSLQQARDAPSPPTLSTLCPAPSRASVGPGIPRQRGPVGAESNGRGLARSAPRPPPGARPTAGHAPGPLLCLQHEAPSPHVSDATRGSAGEWGAAGGRGVLTSPLLAVRFCSAPAQASRVASFLLLPMRFR